MADDDGRGLGNNLLCRRFGLIRIASVIDRAICELLPEEAAFRMDIVDSQLDPAGEVDAVRRLRPSHRPDHGNDLFCFSQSGQRGRRKYCEGGEEASAEGLRRSKKEQAVHSDAFILRTRWLSRKRIEDVSINAATITGWE